MTAIYYGATAKGLEPALVNELNCIVPHNVLHHVFRGGVVFSCNHDVAAVARLRSLDTIFAFLQIRHDVPHSEEDAIPYFESLANELPWDPAFKLFRDWTSLSESPVPDSDRPSGGTAVRIKVQDSSAEEIGVPWQPSSITFRVTCERICHKWKKHGFTSPQAAGLMGHGIQQKFGWKADMRQFDLEVQAWILDGSLLLAIPLIYSQSTGVNSDNGSQPGNKKIKVEFQAKAHHAERQLYSRRVYRSALVGTALKPSTAYALLKLADIQPGHIILDPMCGGGTIPLEASDWLGSHVATIGGDNSSEAVDASAANSLKAVVASGRGDRGCDVIQWDACSLPLRASSVDRVVCDMPFGVRCGNVKVREAISPKVAKEVVRVLKHGSGVALFMAQSKSLAMQMSALVDLGLVAMVEQHLCVEMEGIRVGIMIVRRTVKPFHA